MLIVLRMARIAILRSGLEIRQRVGGEMTLSAAQVCVTTFEFESDCIVVKVVHAVHAIMAGETIGAVREEMSLSEDKVYIAVAGLAGV